MTDLDLRPLFEATDGQPPAVMRDMRLEVGGAMTDLLLRSTFSADGGQWAMEMHRRLRSPVSTESRGWAKMTLVEAPPVAWEVLARWCRRTANAVMPGSTKAERGRSRSLARLALKVDTEIDRLAKHPAYHGVAVLGVEPMILPAFRCGDALGPTPGRAMASALGEVGPGSMAPYATQVRGEVMTVWRWVSDEAEPGAVR